MGKKAEYRSAIRSRKLIRAAFLELLKKKELSKISVTDIVTMADINRTTFYAHYPDVRGVLEEIENDIIDHLMEVLKGFAFDSFFENPVPVLMEVNHYLEADLELYGILFRCSGADLFLERLKGIFWEYMQQDPTIPQEVRNSRHFVPRVCYFAGGIVDLYKQWFLGRLECELAEIPIVVGRILTASAQTLRRSP